MEITTYSVGPTAYRPSPKNRPLAIRFPYVPFVPFSVTAPESYSSARAREERVVFFDESHSDAREGFTDSPSRYLGFWTVVHSGLAGFRVCSSVPGERSSCFSSMNNLDLS